MSYQHAKIRGSCWLMALSATSFLLFFTCAISAQSLDLSFPTAVTENQISGHIKARDIGDGRLTTYYYTFNGTQGDLFVNVVTKNLSGSIDVFAADAMRPLTKILVYADLGISETGRVIYLRKPEKLILRVEGRTPNDDPAEFQIKFAGGFEAAVPRTDEPPVPKVGELPQNESGVRVNSVGTIVAVIPKATPAPKTEKKDDEKVETAKQTADRTDEKTAEQSPAGTDEPATTEKIVKEPTVEKKTPATTAAARNRRAAGNSARPPRNQKPTTTRNATKTTASAAEDKDEPAKPAIETDERVEPPAKAPNPLANVSLVIVFKDGTKVERPMTEVLRFTADQTTLTIINKNGRTAKFSILEVASVTIQ
jgi:hypothetical protein